MNSMLLFASVSFGAMAYLVMKLVKPGARGWSLAWRILLAGVLTPPTMALGGIPSSLFTDIDAKAWVLGIELGLVWMAGAWVLVAHLRRRRSEEAVPMTPFARIYPAAYLAVMAVFWVVTADSIPLGGVLYAIACFVGAVALLAALYTGRRRADVVAA
jgi:hypothetical protein